MGWEILRGVGVGNVCISSLATLGPFTVRHDEKHCTIRISDDVIVVTGGRGEDHVTEYHLIDGKGTVLPPLSQQRYDHACGIYQNPGGQQVGRLLILIMMRFF